jgi:hypothetical protein
VVVKVYDPKSDNLGQVLHSTLLTLREYFAHGDADIVTFDLSHLKFAHPLTVLPLACLSATDKRVGFFNEGGTKKYLDTVHFPHGNTMGTEKVTGSYIPVTVFPTALGSNRPDETDRIISGFNTYLDEIVKDREVLRAIRHIVDELSANINEHSMAQKGFLMAQFYPKKELLHICIADCGDGIRGSYSRAGVPVTDDIDAMGKAARGISSKKQWHENERGFGISTSRKIAQALGGTCFIVSGSSVLINNEKIVDLSQENFRWKGTLCAISAKVKDSGNLNFYKLVE